MSAPILIFGATGGVGAALALRLHAQGRSLHLAGRDPARLSELGQKIGAARSVCDVTDTAQIEETVAAAAGHGALGGLAFCVGSIVLAPLRRQTRASFREAFELNVVSAAEAVRVAQAPLKAGGGAVVLFSSVAVAQGFANHAAISAAKGGVEGLGRALAADLAPDVRVNVVAPSLMRTRIAAPLAGSEQMAGAIAALHPIARLGEADDAAAMAAFLLDGQSSWITGQVFAVDGGRSRVRTKG